MKLSPFIIVLSLALSACGATSGRDFPHPDAARLRLGQTTVSDVTALLGQPEDQVSWVGNSAPEATGRARTAFEPAVVPGAYARVSYHFKKMQDPALGGDIKSKTALFTFRDNKLAGYSYVSNFPDDGTSFDETKLSLLRKGVTTRPDVEGLFGVPSGQAIWPSIEHEGQLVLTYVSVAFDPSTRRASDKTLAVLFGADGRMIDYQFSSRTTDIGRPAPPAGPGFIPLPVPIPIHK